MSIAAANLWSRNIYRNFRKAYLHRLPTDEQETKQSKIASLVVKFGAVALLVLVDPQYSLDLQLIAGVIILQTLPAVAIALYTRWFHVWGLLAGWAVGLTWGLSMIYSIPNRSTGVGHLGGAALELGKLSILGWHPFAGSSVQIYPGFIALLANVVVAVVITIVLRWKRVPNGTDETNPPDYYTEAEFKRHEPVARAVHSST
jgi:SSS family solute:Na+ symporter